MEVLLVVLAVSTVLGLLYRRLDGRVRVKDSTDRSAVLAALGEQPGERATLLQFSSAFCAPCRATRRVLADVAGSLEGVRHVEVDAESHLELVRELGVLKTPTTLVLDGRGHEAFRAAGQPTRQAVLGALGCSV
ncbi:MAG: trxA 3 [Frankiales bacterium]|nr:trxA 3 [Frankiales bacterium]